MNALTTKLNEMAEIIVAAGKWHASIDWTEKQEASVYEQSRKNQEAESSEIIAPNGAKVSIKGVFATGNKASHCRFSFKVNGKRAKQEEVEALFA